MAPPFAEQPEWRAERQQEFSTMKAAIPLFGKRVSPHFSTAAHVLFIEIEGVRICSKTKIGLARLSLTGRRAKLLNLGIDVPVCGGIDRTTRAWFETRGIRVEDNRMGDPLEILKNHLITSYQEQRNEA
jgi:predicted Fe-Mo cluster-binding NifX family protein